MNKILSLLILILISFGANAQTVSPLSSGGGGSGTVTSVGLSVPASSLFGVTGSPVTTSGTLVITTAGTSGGIPYFDTTSTLNSSAALTANLPVIGGGAGAAPSVGTRSGNTTGFATFTGSTTSGRCVQWDASGNLVQASGGCVTGAGGSTTQLQYNNAGALGGISGWTTDGTNVLTGGASTTLAIGGATIGTNALAVTGTILSNNDINIASSSGINLTGSTTVARSSSGIANWAGTLGLFGSGGSLAVTVSSGIINITSAYSLAWNSDLFLYRDAANTLAQRNGTTAQIFNIYNTYTNASNYERLQLTWSGNVAYLNTTAAGTGAGRPLVIRTDSTFDLTLGTNAVARWVVNGANGHFLAGVDNTYDIGASGATRPRNIFVAGNVTSGGFTAGNGFAIKWGTNSAMVSATDGNITFYNTGLSSFGLLQFGGLTSSFPALKRSSAVLEVKLADDSAYAGLNIGITLGQTTTTVGALGSAATAGQRKFVTDALTPVFGSTVVGGGAVAVPVYSDGSAWIVG